MRNIQILNIKCELFSTKKQRYVIFPVPVPLSFNLAAKGILFSCWNISDKKFKKR